ncbi:MAG: hypothetical protein WED07_04515 [Candidatus Freyarchaeum deiterrae]
MLSFFKTILRNPLYTGIVYGVEYFVTFSVVPLLVGSVAEQFGIIIQSFNSLILIIIGAGIATLIFFQKFLRRSHFRLSGGFGIARYLVSLGYTYVLFDMLHFIWVYGSIYQILLSSILHSSSMTWITVDYSFVLWVVIIAFLIRFVRYSYQIIFASDLKGEKGVETLEEEIKEEVED